MKLAIGWFRSLLGCGLLLVAGGCSRQQPAGPPAAAPAEPQASAPRPDVAARDEGPPLPRVRKTENHRPSSGQAASEVAANAASAAAKPAARLYPKPDRPRPPRPTPAPAAAQPAKMPPVVMTEGHAALCRVRVGDLFPEIELNDLDGTPRRLRDLMGQRLTVVCFWSGKQVLARAELADLTPDVVDRFGDQGVAVVGIAEEPTADQARHWATDAGAAFPILLDPEGKAWAAVGREKLPRTYLLDAEGKILWFDIEYSRATRRELRQAIRAALGGGESPESRVQSPELRVQS